MRIFDIARIASKTLKGRWAAVPIAAAAISMFCLCYAGAIITTVGEEKSKPYELSVAGGSGKLTDENIAGVSKLPGVSAVTPAIDVPAKIAIGERSAELVLSGIRASYLSGGLENGVVFPEESVMPYIVLNKAALGKFSNSGREDEAEDESGTENGDTASADTPETDALNSSATIQLDEVTVTAKICGILADGKAAAPEAYISLSAAKQLLFLNGENAAYSRAKARVKDMGEAARVSESIEALGLIVENPNGEIQAKWDRESNEMVYLMITGVFCLICLAVLLTMLKKVSLLEHGGSWSALIWTGFREKDIRRVFIFQSFFISCIGTMAGLLISLSLPSFLPQELNEKSVFMLNIPFLAAVVCAGVNILAGTTAMFGRKFADD